MCTPGRRAGDATGSQLLGDPHRLRALGHEPDAVARQRTRDRDRHGPSSRRAS